MMLYIKLILGDEELEALRARVGKKGRATKDEVRSWATHVLEVTLDDIGDEYREGVYTVEPEENKP